jgi:hypothetical protein
MAFRLTSCAGDSIGDADTLDEALELAKGAPPGRYRLDKLYRDPATGLVRAWEWGAITKGVRGGIRLEFPPWIA